MNRARPIKRRALVRLVPEGARPSAHVPEPQRAAHVERRQHLFNGIPQRIFRDPRLSRVSAAALSLSLSLAGTRGRSGLGTVFRSIDRSRVTSASAWGPIVEGLLDVPFSQKSDGLFARRGVSRIPRRTRPRRARAGAVVGPPQTRLDHSLKTQRNFNGRRVAPRRRRSRSSSL